MNAELTPYEPPAALPVQHQSVMHDRAVERLGEWARAASAAHQVAQGLCKTSFVPQAFKGKPEEATAAILAGSEVGLSPLAALRSFDIISGTAAPRALTLRAIVQSQGHQMWTQESTTTRAIVCGQRMGSSKVERSTWTMDRAKGLGLTGKDNWRKQPQAMLLARATSECARMVAADAILGIAYAAEEITDSIATGGELPADAQPGEPQPATRKMSRRPRQPAPEPADQPDQPEPTEQADQPELNLADEPAESPLLNTSGQLARHMFALLGNVGITDKAERLAYVSDVVGREVTTSRDMTEADAEAVIGALNLMRDRLRAEQEQAAQDDDKERQG